MALGARIVDARWLIDSQCAGTWLDCDSYGIWGDAETYDALFLRSQRNDHDDGDSGAAMLPNGLSSIDELSWNNDGMIRMSRQLNNSLDGLTFGLLQGQGLEWDELLDKNHTNGQSHNSQFPLKTQALTRLQVCRTSFNFAFHYYL